VTSVKARMAGAYIVKAAESRPARVASRVPPHGYRNVPTEVDRALVAALLGVKGRA
jgi:hypothetical protein